MNGRQKKVLSVLLAGSAILAWRGYALVAKYGLPARAQAETGAVDAGVPAAPQPADVGKQPVVEAAVLEQQRSIAERPWGRDPFADVPGMSPEPTPREQRTAPTRTEHPPQTPALQFAGVSRSNGRWLAVVRDRIVAVGDTVDEAYEVTKITKNTITVTSGGWSFRYALGADQPVVYPTAEER